jgi:hypothetical protein
MRGLLADRCVRCRQGGIFPHCAPCRLKLPPGPASTRELAVIIQAAGETEVGEGVQAFRDLGAGEGVGQVGRGGRAWIGSEGRAQDLDLFGQGFLLAPALRRLGKNSVQG